MKPPLATKKLTTLSLLSAIALALYAVESALPPIVPIPGIKLGLANIITLVVLWKYSAKDAFFVLLVRILLATLFFGQAISLLYSLSGGLLPSGNGICKAAVAWTLSVPCKYDRSCFS